MSSGVQPVPGAEGTVGPFPSQYGHPHVYARDVQSGSGNCVCARPPVHRVHVASPLAPRIGCAGETCSPSYAATAPNTRRTA